MHLVIVAARDDDAVALWDERCPSFRVHGRVGAQRGLRGAGIGLGLARLVMLMLGLPTIREATFLHRGPNRITP